MDGKKLNISLVIFVVFVLAALGVLVWQGVGMLGDVWKNTSRPVVEITIAYAPEEESYLKDVIANFNKSYDDGKNPVTGQRLKDTDKKIKITGQNISSGTAKDQIVAAVMAQSGQTQLKPTIYSPSVGHWLRVVNYETGREVFKLEEAVPTANAPVVIAIWESRLNALKAKANSQDIGWQELLGLFRSPNGWLDYSQDIERKKVFYGATDPTISSTALSTLISTYYANAKYATGDQNIEQLTLENVKDDNVRNGVKDIQKLIKHYSSRTTEFKEYIAQGPEYLDFVALEENDLIYINQGKTQYKPPEKLVALYPKEGTFVHEHPFAVPNVDWVTQEQRDGAKMFTDYVISESVQKKVLENGFRPVNPAVALASPIVSEFGVDPSQPKALLKIPSSEVITKVQQDWNFVKKRSEVILLVDTSGSMDENDKMDKAKEAMQVFVDKFSQDNQISLISFNSDIKENIPLGPLEANRARLKTEIEGLKANGSTSLYAAVNKAIDKLNKDKTSDDVIRCVILLSDGQDTDRGGLLSLSDVTDKLETLKKSDKPVLVIPIAYGADADLKALNAIAKASSTRTQTGNTDDIQKLLAVISSYF